MSQLITPESVRAMYEYLSSTPPFLDWNMRDADDVHFVACQDHDCGWFKTFIGSNDVEIAVSSRRVGSTNLLAETVAHEMVHLHLHDTGVDHRGRHGAAFRACAALVCAAHGWDVLNF